MGNHKTIPGSQPHSPNIFTKDLAFLKANPEKGYAQTKQPHRPHGCGSKTRCQHGTLVSKNMDQNLRNPSCLILSHTHMSVFPSLGDQTLWPESSGTRPCSATPASAKKPVSSPNTEVPVASDTEKRKGFYPSNYLKSPSDPLNMGS